MTASPRTSLSSVQEVDKEEDNGSKENLAEQDSISEKKEDKRDGKEGKEDNEKVNRVSLTPSQEMVFKETPDSQEPLSGSEKLTEGGGADHHEAMRNKYKIFIIVYNYIHMSL